MLHMIGCGGTGTWFLRGITKVDRHETVTIFDGDTVERKNLDRQLFDDKHVGMNKADALASIYYPFPGPCVIPCPGYYSSMSVVHEAQDWLFCCADNHAARRECLAACDNFGCSAIIGGNEYTDAEAYLYFPAYRGTPNDPRVFYPEIATSHDNDPLLREGCGKLVASKPQLAQANMAAASMMLQLYWFWQYDPDGLKPELSGMRPIHHLQTKWKLSTIREGDRCAAENTGH